MALNILKYSGEFRLQSNKGSINDIMDNKLKNKLSLLEEDIRKLRLKDAKRKREELEQKLLLLNESVENLKYKQKKSMDEKKLTKEEKQRLEEELEKKKKDAEEFVLRIEAEKRERKKKESERLKAEREKIERELKEENDKLKEQKKEILKKRREESIKTYELLKRKRLEDIKKFEEASAQPNPLPENYLYKKLKDRYNKEVLTPTLENKKKELAFKRNQLKCITRKELSEHLKKYQQHVIQKDEERLSDLKARRSKEQEVKEFISKMKTSTLEKELLRAQLKREEREQKSNEKQELRAKMVKYSKLIKGMHPVIIDANKAEELKKSIEKLHNSKQIPMLKRKTPSTKLRITKPMGEKDPLSSVETNKDTERNKRDKIEVATTKQAKIPKKNPLAEFRKKREEKIQKQPEYDWVLNLKNQKLDTQEKYERLMSKAKKIEEQAMRQEEIMKVAKTERGLEANIELGGLISEKYLNAIKAKLAILDNL